MKLSEYDGPRVRFDWWFVWVAGIPIVGLMMVVASISFLHDADRETTEVPAQARGAVLLGLLSHSAYGWALVVTGVVP